MFLREYAVRATGRDSERMNRRHAVCDVRSPELSSDSLQMREMGMKQRGQQPFIHSVVSAALPTTHPRARCTATDAECSSCSDSGVDAKAGVWHMQCVSHSHHTQPVCFARCVSDSVCDTVYQQAVLYKAVVYSHDHASITLWLNVLC